MDEDIKNTKKGGFMLTEYSPQRAGFIYLLGAIGLWGAYNLHQCVFMSVGH